MKDFLRRPSAVASRDSPSSSSADRILNAEPALTSPRMSILPSVRIPLLRRQESEAPPSNKKSPLLSVCLSSQSFLDSCIKVNTSGHVLYEIKTTGTSTSILRSDSNHGFVRAASVKWPRVLPAQANDADVVLVQMKGTRWAGGDSLLRHSSALNGSRKFSIPEYSQSMKWKRFGAVYWCTTSSVKGPIAILEMAKGSVPTKLTLYETLHDKYDRDGLTHFEGVSVLLMDYVLTTAVLLVTDVQEWMVVQKYEESATVPSLPLPSHVASSTTTDKSLTSDPQLRKIMYGEPIFPKLLRHDLQSKHSSSSTTPSMPGGPLTPTSSTSAIGPSYLSTYGDSEDLAPLPSVHILNSKRALGSIMSTGDDYDDDFSIAPSTRPPSPATESVFFSSSSAPGHQQFDPLFYGSQQPPPVPPLPADLYPSHSQSFSYSRSRNSRMLTGASLPGTPTAAVSRAFQPAQPSPLSSDFPSNVHTSLVRGVSPSTHSGDPPRTFANVSPERASSIRSVTSTMSRRSVTTGVRRPLPRPPPIPPPPASAIETAPTASLPTPKASLTPRRAQSSGQLRNQYSSPEPASTREQIPPVPTRPQRSLPQPPPSTSISIIKPLATLSQDEAGELESMQTKARSGVVSTTEESGSRLAAPIPAPLDVYGRRPPITKVSQEELTNWVHALTSPQRDLPPDPLPSSSIYDLPPPAYETIDFGNLDNRGHMRRQTTTRRRAATQSGPGGS